MSQSPIEQSQSLCIGTVDFVSPNEIKVALDLEAPESVALNAGGPRPFPRVNSYVLIPVDTGYIVGQIEWLTVERSPFPKRRGMQDFGLIDLPYPLRKMSLNPVGTLRKKAAGPNEIEEYTFRRGADALPSIGTSVLLPTDHQLRSIVESGERKRVRIGTSPLANHAEVFVDPNRLYGRHLAVLGNTGSGKSCSVAGLIRWSLQSAEANNSKIPNARFIILDPNGEYSKAFAEPTAQIKARILKVDPSSSGSEALLQVPLWFWNSAEWSSFTQASAKVQRPLLRRALREIKAARFGPEVDGLTLKKQRVRRVLSSILIDIRKDIHSRSFVTAGNAFGKKLRANSNDISNLAEEVPEFDFANLITAMRSALTAQFSPFKDKETQKQVENYTPFSEYQITPILTLLENTIEPLGGIVYHNGPDEDSPSPFMGSEFVDHLKTLAEQEDVTQFVDYLIARISMFLGDQKLKSIIDSGAELTLQSWLEGHLGAEDSGRARMVIIDLSLVPSEVIHVITAVIARMIFESLQRHRKVFGDTLPTVLVMEEAHNFVRRYKEDNEDYNASAICCQVFERIAREGRKFGLGLVLSSQRPSELSQTVLSQCNTFLLHRISNDKDQELVHRLVPDNLKGLLRELPSLPSQHAILLGWASELPVLIRMNDLPKSQRPHSDDPDFWEVWTGMDDNGAVVERKVNWKSIADDWQGVTTETESSHDS